MEQEMTRNLAVVIPGGALVLALAASVGPLGATGASASAAGVASATLLMPSDPPIIRGSSAQAAPAMACHHRSLTTPRKRPRRMGTPRRLLTTPRWRLRRVGWTRRSSTT